MLKKFLVVLAACSFLATAAFGDDCKNRGTLDEMYCDENSDLVADTPKDPKDWKDPNTLVFTYTPVEDPAVYKDAFADFQAYLEQHGHMPLPPYIDREDRLEDRERYQTVFAREDGSVAAPTAGLHFDRALLAELERKNLFLVPLDDERRWYRYHHLFGELLRSRHADWSALLEQLEQRREAEKEPIEIVEGEVSAEQMKLLMELADRLDRVAEKVESGGPPSAAGMRTDPSSCWKFSSTAVGVCGTRWP